MDCLQSGMDKTIALSLIGGVFFFVEMPGHKSSQKTDQKLMNSELRKIDYPEAARWTKRGCTARQKGSAFRLKGGCLYSVLKGCDVMRNLKNGGYG